MVVEWRDEGIILDHFMLFVLVLFLRSDPLDGWLGDINAHGELLIGNR